MLLFSEEHGKRLPTVRIHKAILKDFKSVKYGEIVFDCSKQFVPNDTMPDILGIYGQNGSGKTAFIEALSILKSLLSGEQVRFPYADCIAAGADHSELEFTFELQYPTNPITVRKVVYSFYLSTFEAEELEKADSELEEVFDEIFSKQVIRRHVRVYNEVVKIGGDIDGANKKCMPVIDTSLREDPFGPSSKRRLFYKASTDMTVKLMVNKQLAFARSKSFIFMVDTIKLFDLEGQDSPYFEVLKELRYFGKRFLFVVDTKSMATVSSNVFLPLFGSDIMINTVGPNILSEPEYEELHRKIAQLGEVLPQYVPGLGIAVKVLGPATLDDGSEGRSVEVVVLRGDRELPIRCESDGVRKIISVMNLIIRAYNQKSTTVAIDELDAGIFEHLLGELLQIFAESGKGQLIFTSHNLRPLEVLDKKYICFTTTNPENRYIRMKNVGVSNNLRNLYFREIQINEQDEELYRVTKKHKIVAALRKAGS